MNDCPRCDTTATKATKTADHTPRYSVEETKNAKTQKSFYATNKKKKVF